LHFTPQAHWINDPNGLVFLDGEYHLFYQYHPHSNVWGTIHWGHAVSRDLIQWAELPIALYPDELGAIFSGSAVIDRENTAGFGANAMVAIFTHFDAGLQQQSLAFSTDRGRTWAKYSGNPVIPCPEGIRDFRDPKVFWHEQDGAPGHWVLLLAAGQCIWIYASPDLKTWEKCSEFGAADGAHDGVWETPELLELPIDGGPEKRWLLTVGIGEGAGSDRMGVQYFIGHFDGRRFVNEHAPETILRADHGTDFYAAQAWNNTQDGRTLWIGWMSNWYYANQTPTTGWRGAMTLPRELALSRRTGAIRLVQRPVAELKRYRDTHWRWPAQPAGARSLPTVHGAALEIVAWLATTAATGWVGFRLTAGPGEETLIGYDLQQQELFVDRRRSGATAFHAGFGSRQTAPLQPTGGGVKLHCIVDRCSVELFGNDGQTSLTALIFPTGSQFRIEPLENGCAGVLMHADIYALRVTD
jgi:fructan beta-fructosidase